MLPKHLKKVPEDRKAIAPYNFVELPDKVVPAEPLHDCNCYNLNRHTGKIKCTLTTESPLYTRCGLTPDNFTDFGDTPNEELEPKERLKRAEFFSNPANHKPTIPGSSLRGMLRTLVEIVSFGKIERVSNQQHFFFRAVAANPKSDSLGEEYKSLLKKVKSGFLIKQNDGWYIRPAQAIDGSPFIWVKERDLSRIRTIVKMNQLGYRPQHINVSFGDTQLKSPRRFTRTVSTNLSLYPHQGVLVTSGNMLEASDNPENLHRRNHCIVATIDESASLLKINDEAIQHYCSALTDFQKQEPFHKKMGALQEDERPIFYCEPQDGQIEVTLFGHSPNFRIPYSPSHDGCAASAVDFIPKDLGKSDTADLADAIFGFVRNEKCEKDQALAGRVFISDAIYEKAASEDIWFTGNPERTVTPQILSTPKPTTFQHYLVQTDPEARKRELKHYANKPDKETVIRGHKLYWHKGRSPSIVLDNPEASESQTTQIKPIKPGVSFTFTIDFENLSDVELGAILWVLKRAEDEEYRLSLGMGKPLGMGAVKITHQLHLSDRKQRYTKLFKDNNWNIGEIFNTSDTHERCVKVFEKYVLDHISEADQPNTGKATNLEELPRIKMLLAMLSWSGPLDIERTTRYMEIQRDREPKLEPDGKEYKERRVLPSPLQVMEWEDNRKVNNSNPSPQPGTNVGKPILKKSTQSNRPIQKGKREDKGGSNSVFVRPPKPPKR
jgi:CRISPR-associated protein (TIGR03986 family)